MNIKQETYVVHKNNYRHDYQRREFLRQKLSQFPISHFVAIKFGKFPNRFGYMTSLGQSDIEFAISLIEKWVWRMDRALLGTNAYKRPKSERIVKYYLFPEALSNGEPTPLHFHGVLYVEPAIQEKFILNAQKNWKKLIISSRNTSFYEIRNKKIKNKFIGNGYLYSVGEDAKLFIEQYDQEKEGIKYCTKESHKDWNFENFITSEVFELGSE